MRLDINYRKSLKNKNTWRVNNTLRNDQEITEEIKEEIKKNLEANDSENTKTTQKPMGCSKRSLRGKFTAIRSYLKKQEKPQINNLTLHLKELQKEEQAKLKSCRRKEIIKIRAEINEMEKKKTIARLIKLKPGSLIR